MYQGPEHSYGPFARGDLVCSYSWYFGIVVKAGPKMYEVRWHNGDTSRHAQTYLVNRKVLIERMPPDERPWAEQCLAELRRMTGINPARTT